MIRVQVYLEQDDDSWLEASAQASRTSKAALIREGIRLLRQQEVPPEQDPLLDLIAHASYNPDGLTDVGERHDWYLGEAKLARSQQ